MSTLIKTATKAHTSQHSGVWSRKYEVESTLGIVTLNYLVYLPAISLFSCVIHLQLQSPAEVCASCHPGLRLLRFHEFL